MTDRIHRNVFCHHPSVSSCPPLYPPFLLFLYSISYFLPLPPAFLQHFLLSFSTSTCTSLPIFFLSIFHFLLYPPPLLFNCILHPNCKSSFAALPPLSPPLVFYLLLCANTTIHFLLLLSSSTSASPHLLTHSSSSIFLLHIILSSSSIFFSPAPPSFVVLPRDS